MNWSLVLGWVITDEHSNDFVGLDFENKQLFSRCVTGVSLVRHGASLK